MIINELKKLGDLLKTTDPSQKEVSELLKKPAIAELNSKADEVSYSTNQNGDPVLEESLSSGDRIVAGRIKDKDGVTEIPPKTFTTTKITERPTLSITDLISNNIEEQYRRQVQSAYREMERPSLLQMSTYSQTNENQRTRDNNIKVLNIPERQALRSILAEIRRAKRSNNTIRLKHFLLEFIILHAVDNDQQNAIDPITHYLQGHFYVNGVTVTREFMIHLRDEESSIVNIEAFINSLGLDPYPSDIGVSRQELQERVPTTLSETRNLLSQDESRSYHGAFFEMVDEKKPLPKIMTPTMMEKKNQTEIITPKKRKIEL